MQIQPTSVQSPNVSYSRTKSQKFGVSSMTFLKGKETETASTLAKLGTKELWEGALAIIRDLRIKLPEEKPRDFNVSVFTDDAKNIRYRTEPTIEGVEDSGLLTPPHLHNCTPELRAQLEGKSQIDKFLVMFSKIPENMAKGIQKARAEANEFLLKECAPKN